MDTKSNKKTRSSAKIATCRIRRKHPICKIGESRTLQECKDEEKSCVSRDIKENAQKKVVKKNIYEPIRQQFMLLIEYLNILEMRTDMEHQNEIICLIEFIDIMKRKCEMYLNFELMKAGKKNG